ncbi:MAG TPA: flagellin lysine-N-methylase [Myxococcaceae bacterium]|nr:flagellin lysine-N-methylase [Myxococcaceae bacterium]
MPRLTALRYMTRFRCTAGECPDTCCAGVKLMLTEADRARLVATADTGARRERVARTVEAAPDLGEGYVAVLRTFEEGRCGFLDPDHLCSIQREHGPQALPAGCDRFPRVFSRFEDRRELSATLSCPEAARLALTAEDALDVVDVSPELFAPEPPRPDDDARPSPYSAPADAVHAAVGEVLRDARLPVALRVAVVGELGRRTESFFHAGATGLDRAALDRELAAFRAPETIQAVAEQLTSGPWRATQALQAVMGLMASLPDGAPPRAHLVPAAMNQYLAEAKAAYPTLGTEGGPPLWDVLWERVQVRRQFLHQSLGGALEPSYARFLINDWHREWYTQSPTLSAHAFKLAVRLSSVMLLAMSAPGLYRQPAPPRSEIDAVAVDAAQIYSRHVERSADVLSALEGLLTPQALGTDGFGRVATFARLAV